MRKFFTFLLALTVGAGTIFAANGTCGDNLTWDLTDGVLTISGTGAMTDYPTVESTPWYSQKESITSIVMSDGITNIGNYAFNRCFNLASISIPNSVTRIGRGAFVHCQKLTSISIPDKVTSIGEDAFSNCYALASVVIPEGVVRIEDATFIECTGLTSVTIPNSVTVIGHQAFDRCTALSEVTIPIGVTDIETTAFHYCEALTSITCKAIIPPLCGDRCFEYVNNSVTVKVPAESAAEYKITTGWNAFSDNTQGENWYKASGIFGPGVGHLAWALDENGVLTISGKGDMPDWKNISEEPWYSKRSSVKSVVITYGVTSVGSYAFYYCSSMTSASLPASISTIGKSAFDNCSALTSIVIPDGITSIEKNVFNYCSALTSVTIPNSVTSIGENAFAACSKLASIEIPSGVTSIGKSAFTGCQALTSIEIPSGLTNLESSVFYGSGLTSIEIPDNITGIGDAAFQRCKGLTSITIPNSVKNLGEQAFQECTALASVTIGSGVTSIGKSAFNGCYKLTSFTIPGNVTTIGDMVFYNCEKLSEVTISDGVTSIGNSAFYGCHLLTVTLPKSLTTLGNSVFALNTILKSIDVDPENPNFSSENGVLYNKDKTVLVMCPNGKKDEFIIPDHVTTIGDYAFHYCASLKKMTLHSNLVSIGKYAFYYCNFLSSITSLATTPPAADATCFTEMPAFTLEVPSQAVETYKNTSPWSKAKAITALPDFPVSGTCGQNLTWTLDGNGLLTISGTGDMTSWSDTWKAPWNDYLQYVDVDSIVLEEGVTCIGSYAFSTCKFKSIAIPNSVKTIYNRAFYGCESLESVTMGNSVETIWEGAFSGCKGLKTVTLGSNVKWIMDKAFNGCSSLTSIELPWRVYTISPYVFYGCSSLASVTLTENVESIDKYAFAGCTSLTEFSFPSKVTSISECTFSGCTSLSSITISKNIEYIYYNAFDGCSALTSIVVEEGNPKFDSRDNCNAIIYTEGNGLYFGCKTTVIPKDIIEIMDMAFLGCTGLTEITIPENVVEIGEKAFADCKNLKTVFCYAVEPPPCGTDAFKNTGYGTLYVPEASVEAYSNSESWINAFSSIKAIPVPYGTCGDNVTWDFTDGVLTISGTGAMDCSAPWTFYNTSIKSLVIEEGVTDLGNIYFADCPSLASIEVAADNPAFCAIDDVLFNKDKTILIQYPVGHKRTEYIIPATVDSIGAASFEVCENLTSVTIPASVTKIGQLAFYGCTGLKTIICEASTPPVCSKYCYFTDFCFPWCFEEVDKESAIVYVPKGTIEAYQAAEEWSAFKNIQVNPIAASGFCGAEGKNLQWTLNIDSVLTISGEGAMADNVSSWIPYRSAIKSIVIEEGVTNIGDEAFAECTNLTAVSIPSSVTSIGNGAFLNCSSLPAIILPKEITSIKDNTFSGCAKLSDFIVPARVTAIGKYAFSGCAALTTMEIPDRVTQIGEKAFNNCSGLTSISCIGAPAACGEDCFAGVDKSIPLSVPQEYLEDYKKAKEWKDFPNIKGVMCSIDSGTFGDAGKFKWRLTCSGKLIIDGTGGIAHGSPDAPWKEYASSVRLIELSEGITDIGGGGGYDVFGNLENLESISLPSTLTAIKNAFNNNPQLATVSIPNSVTEIDGSFNSCPGLNIVVFGYSLQKLHDSFMGSLAMYSDVVSLAVTPPGELQNSFKGGHHWALYVPAESVSRYEAYQAGWGYFAIWSLDARPGTHIIASGIAGDGITWELDSNGILTIKGKGDMDSWGIPAPASVGKHYIPTDEPSAPWYPYHSDILYVVIEGGITSIGDNAFYGCTDIQSITCYATTPPTCGEGAFEGIEASGLLCVPEGSESAYQSADKWNIFTEVQPIEQQPTAIDEVEAQWTNEEMRKCENTKLLINGQLYILHNGTLYGVQGQKVR